MYEFFWVARRGSTEGLRLWHLLLILGYCQHHRHQHQQRQQQQQQQHLHVSNGTSYGPDLTIHNTKYLFTSKKGNKKERTMTWIINGSPSLDQQSQWQAITITTLIFTTSMLLVVSLRFWIRKRILHREDWLTFGTMLFSLIYSASVILQTRYGLGLPVVLQPVQDWRKYMMINYASRPFYLLGL